jgi:hypothetical protein
VGANARYDPLLVRRVSRCSPRFFTTASGVYAGYTVIEEESDILGESARVVGIAVIGAGEHRTVGGPQLGGGHSGDLHRNLFAAVTDQLFVAIASVNASGIALTPPLFPASCGY